MNNPNLNPTEIKENIETKLSRYFGCTAQEASADQMYKAVSMTIRDILTEKRGEYKKEVNKAGAKRVYYMCMEFLLGRSLKTNVCNLGLQDEYKDALSRRVFVISVFQTSMRRLLRSLALHLRISTSASPMRVSVTAVLEDLRLALWIPCPLLTTLQRDFLSATSTASSSR